MDPVRKSDFFSTVLVLCLVLNSLVLFCNGGITSKFVRKLEKTIDMPLDSDVFRVPPGYNAPQQVHITQGDVEGKAIIVSWVTQEAKGSNTVVYWKQNSSKKLKARGKTYTYKFYNYTSGYIHHCPIRNLEYNTKYYYVVGVGQTEREFWFFTPPEVGPDVPYTFGLIGDLGQSFDSNITLTHYENNPTKGQAVLFVGDISYADTYPDHDNRRWDSWGRFAERSTAYQPWIWTTGNHELDFAPEIVMLLACFIFKFHILSCRFSDFRRAMWEPSYLHGRTRNHVLLHILQDDRHRHFASSSLFLLLALKCYKSI